MVAIPRRILECLKNSIIGGHFDNTLRLSKNGPLFLFFTFQTVLFFLYSSRRLVIRETYYLGLVVPGPIISVSRPLYWVKYKIT